MRYRGFFAVLFLLFASTVLAAEFEDPRQLQQEVLQHLSEIYLDEYGEENFSDNVEINVSALDPRLKLAKCDGQKKFRLTTPNKRSVNVTLKVSCMGSTRWSLHVPSKINIYGEVAVASKSLQRGSIITEADIKLKRVNISKLGYGHIQDVSRALGMELRRNLRMDDAIKLSSVVEPKVIQRGDQVILEAQNVGLSVVTPGTAMANGKIGEHIKVRNNKSKAIIDALVVAPGRVRVSL